jgi:hypothetical protein
MLDLGDPFAREERWRNFSPTHPSGPNADPALARMFADLI